LSHKGQRQKGLPQYLQSNILSSNQTVMAATWYYDFTITFADAIIAPSTSEQERIERVYNINESPQHHWTIAENGVSVAISDEQQEQLQHLLKELRLLPEHALPKNAIVPPFLGCDGTWTTIRIRWGDQQTSYRWQNNPPIEWVILDKIAEYVMDLADIPRKVLAQQQNEVTRKFFERLAARDLSGMLACCHPDIQYRNPFFGLQGAEVGVMWQMWWSYLPDVRVVCQESSIRNGFVDWKADYTYPPTGRYIEHYLSAHLTFVEDKIILHVDRFNLHQWGSSAYGFIGDRIGGWSLFEKFIAANARKLLASFISK
jgi:SnoaL-like domain